MYICMLTIGIVIMRCQGHELSLEKRQTVVLNLEASPEQATQFEDSEVATWFESWGISKQESFMQQGNHFERIVSYAATVPSAQSAKRMIKRITMRLPQFIDNDDRQVIENVIDTTMAEARQKREATDAPLEALEIQVNYYPVQFCLTIQ